MKIITPAQLKVAAHSDKNQHRLEISGIFVDPETQEVAATNGHVLVRVKPSAEQLRTQAPNLDAVMPTTAPKAFATFNGQYLESVLKTFSEVLGKAWKSDISRPFVKVELWGPEKAARFTLRAGDGTEIVALVMPLRVEES